MANAITSIIGKYPKATNIVKGGLLTGVYYGADALVSGGKYEFSNPTAKNIANTLQKYLGLTQYASLLGPKGLAVAGAGLGLDLGISAAERFFGNEVGNATAIVEGTSVKPSKVVNKTDTTFTGSSDQQQGSGSGTQTTTYSNADLLNTILKNRVNPEVAPSPWTVSQYMADVSGRNMLSTMASEINALRGQAYNPETVSLANIASYRDTLKDPEASKDQKRLAARGINMEIYGEKAVEGSQKDMALIYEYMNNLGQKSEETTQKIDRYYENEINKATAKMNEAKARIINNPKITFKDELLKEIEGQYSPSLVGLKRQWDASKENIRSSSSTTPVSYGDINYDNWTVKSVYQDTLNNYNSKPSGIPEEYLPMIDKASKEYGVPKSLLMGIIKQESSGDKDAMSTKGAKGLMQLMEGTAGDIANKIGYSKEDIMSKPEANIMAGAYYISKQLGKYNNNIALALAAYNAGPGNVAKYGGIPPFKETTEYIQKVSGYMNDFKQLEDKNG